MRLRFSPLCMQRDISHTRSPEYIEKCQLLSDNHFTRKRKMPVDKLLLSVVCRKGRTLAIELREFAMAAETERITKAGYLKQRKKLNPEALRDLNTSHVKNTYEGAPIKDIGGYLLLAADGSKVAVPTTSESLERFGSVGSPTAATAGISGLYDVLNSIIISCSVERGNHNEMEAAYKQLRDAPEAIGDRKTIITLDRGYPSLPYFNKMLKEDQKFVVRLSRADYPREQDTMTTDDENVEVKITSQRMLKHIGKPYEQELRDAGSIMMRFVKIRLEGGEMECLATNLAPSEFSTEEICRIYGFRWGIETVFGMLKNNLELGNFTGTKPLLIEQDIHACVYLCNVAMDMAIQGQMDLEESGKNAGRKHKMAVNKSYAIGIIKDSLLKALLEPNADKQEMLFFMMVEEIRSVVEPVRPGRQYERKNNNKNAKHSNTHKRSY